MDISKKIDLCVLGLPKTGTTWLAYVLSSTNDFYIIDEADNLSQLWKKTTCERKKSIIFAESLTDPNFLNSYFERYSAITAFNQRLNFRNTLLTLREPELWTYSLYRQHIKGGGVDSFREYSLGVKPYLNYRSFFEELNKMALNPYVSNFENLKKAPVEYLKSLLKILVSEKEAEGIVEKIPNDILYKKYNVGYKGISIRGLRWVNSIKKLDQKGIISTISDRFGYNTKDLMGSKIVQLFDSYGKSLISDEDEEFMKTLINDNKSWTAIEQILSKNEQMFIPFNEFYNNLRN